MAIQYDNFINFPLSHGVNTENPILYKMAMIWIYEHREDYTPCGESCRAFSAITNSASSKKEMFERSTCEFAGIKNTYLRFAKSVVENIYTVASGALWGDRVYTEKVDCLFIHHGLELPLGFVFEICRDLFESEDEKIEFRTRVIEDALSKVGSRTNIPQEDIAAAKNINSERVTTIGKLKSQNKVKRIKKMIDSPRKAIVSKLAWLVILVSAALFVTIYFNVFDVFPLVWLKIIVYVAFGAVIVFSAKWLFNYIRIYFSIGNNIVTYLERYASGKKNIKYDSCRNEIENIKITGMIPFNKSSPRFKKKYEKLFGCSNEKLEALIGKCISPEPLWVVWLIVAGCLAIFEKI